MPGDAFKKVTSGEKLRIPARLHNQTIDAVQWVQDQQAGLAAGMQGAQPQRTVIAVKNNSDADRERFHVLGLDGPIFDTGTAPYKERPAMVGSKPATDSHVGKFAVLLEPIRLGAVGRACVSGVTIAKVDFQAKWHRWADVKDDDATSLQSRAEPGGAYILETPPDTGVQWAMVRIGNPPPVHFPAKITAVESLGGNRYKYSFSEVEKTDAVHAGWTAKTGGRSGYAYNLVETVGDPTCVPARAGETVWIEEVSYDDAGTEQTEYWFQYEEYDQDASDGGSSGGGGGGHIDVVVCGGWNRCGNFIVLPQKRISYDARGNITGIVAIANDVIPIYQCQSSGGAPPFPPPPPPSSGGGSVSPAGTLYVTGTLTPDATGTYTYRGQYHGQPYWARTDDAYTLWWYADGAFWALYGGDPGVYWYNQTPDSPLGTYAPAAGAEGIPTVSTTP